MGRSPHNDHGVFWWTRCGLPWRDVPPNYGHWKTSTTGIAAADGALEALLAEWRRDTDRAEGTKWTVGVDAGVVRAHQHVVERAINKLKGHRAVATRYEKRDDMFPGTIDVTSIGIWLSEPVP